MADKKQKPQQIQQTLTVAQLVNKTNADIRLTHSNSNEAIINNVKLLNAALMELSDKVTKYEKTISKQSTTIQSLESQLTKSKKLKKNEKK